MEQAATQGGFYVILHNVRSAYNVGAIFRSSDAFGVNKVYLCGYTPVPTQHPSIAKTALGAEESVPWEKFWHTYQLIGRLKAQGVSIVALEQSERSISVDSFTPNFPMALIVGNEVSGLSSRMLSYADSVVEIPMYGMKESLNVSVAFGIAGYNISHKRRQGRK